MKIEFYFESQNQHQAHFFVPWPYAYLPFKAAQPRFLFILHFSLSVMRPNKIKIDVDGNERAVLAGTSKLLCGAREIYFEDGMTSACSDFISFLVANGFVEITREEQFAKSDKKHLVGYTTLFAKTD